LAAYKDSQGVAFVCFGLVNKPRGVLFWMSGFWTTPSVCSSAPTTPAVASVFVLRLLQRLPVASVFVLRLLSPVCLFFGSYNALSPVCLFFGSYNAYNGYPSPVCLFFGSYNASASQLCLRLPVASVFLLRLLQRLPVASVFVLRLPQRLPVAIVVHRLVPIAIVFGTDGADLKTVWNRPRRKA